MFRPNAINGIVISLFFWAVPLHGSDIAGQVVDVHDGDTITVLDDAKQQHKIRLAGIDAPELGQAYGQKSREHLAGLVAGQSVEVDWSKRDKYQRIVGTVLLNGKDLNIEQLRAGLAWHYKRYENEQTLEKRKNYSDAERTAREARQGLWQDAKPIPPWEWRAMNRE